LVVAAYQTWRLVEQGQPTLARSPSERGADVARGTTETPPASSSTSGSISYSGRRSDSPFTTDQFEPSRSPWAVRLQVAQNEESQSPGVVETVRVAVIKDGREVESAILETGQELNADFYSKGPIYLRVECLRDWTLDINP